MPKYIIQREIRYELVREDSGTSEPVFVKEKTLRSKPLDFSNNVGEGETLVFPNNKTAKIEKIIHTRTCSILELSTLGQRCLIKEKMIENFNKDVEENSFIEKL